MSRTHLLIAVLSGLMLPAAHAGVAQPAPVTIDLDERLAGGDQVTARYSKNDLDVIGCGVRMFAEGAGGFGFCQAQDAEGDAALCVTTDPALLAVMGGISDFGFITFAWDEEGDCTRVGFSTQSLYLPRKLDGNE